MRGSDSVSVRNGRDSLTAIQNAGSRRTESPVSRPSSRVEWRAVSEHLLEVLTHPLSPGIRWLPGTARAVLEKALESRNEEGHRLLDGALGGDVDQFISN